MPPFSTGGLGVIPGAGGDVDDMVRRAAWLDAHQGGAAGREDQASLRYTARWPPGKDDGPRGQVAATAYGDLGLLMDRLDQAEGAGACPVHGAGS